MRMSSRILYQDRTVALTDEAMVLRGFTKVLGRPRRVQLGQITSFAVLPESDFPNDRLPKWGVDDRGVWFTRDSQRWRRHHAIEITFANGETVGFTPAHPTRVRELLVRLGVSES
jgi:hypothetical protein